MQEARLIEFFQSIQGEGKYAGVRQVFVRFFECNMHCHWCDTPHSIGDTTRNFRTMNLEEVYQSIADLREGAHSVSLTGGEPLLQAEFIQNLCKRLREDRLLIHLETNGILPDQLELVIDDIDVVSMDLKLPSSTRCRSYWDEHHDFIKIAQAKELFIKTVISKDTDSADVHAAVDMVKSINPDVLFILQPNTFDLGSGVMNVCQDFERYCSQHLTQVRVLPQMHKMMKVR